jgi:hypothetical protein
MRTDWNILIELLHAPAKNPSQMPTKKRLPAASPPTASHMIQRNPDFGKKRRRKE